jgi:hypothetical protein
VHDQQAVSINRTAFDATVHCLTGCAIGEVLGLVIATALGWHDLPSILLAIVLAFAGDTVSIATMEVVDNAVVVAVPGAMAAGLIDLLFWGSLVLSLVIAFVVAWPVNRWLISRGLGHAVVAAHHGHH